MSGHVTMLTIARSLIYNCQASFSSNILWPIIKKYSFKNIICWMTFSACHFCERRFHRYRWVNFIFRNLNTLLSLLCQKFYVNSSSINFKSIIVISSNPFIDVMQDIHTRIFYDLKIFELVKGTWSFNRGYFTVHFMWFCTTKQRFFPVSSWNSSTET